MQPIHDRQPVILETRNYREWLEPNERPPVHLLRVLPDGEMKITLVAAEKLEKAADTVMKGLFD